MSDFKTKLDTYREAVEFLKKDPNNYPYRVRVGNQMRHTQLTQALPKLFTAVREALTEVSYGFIPVGSAADTKTWTTIATEEVRNSVFVDSLKIYRDLAIERIWASMAPHLRVFDSTQFAILDDELRSYMAKFFVDDVKFPDWRVMPPVKTREDLVQTVRNVIETQYGYDYRARVTATDLANAVTETVLSAKAATIAVILQGVQSEDEGRNLANLVFPTGRYSLIAIGSLPSGDKELRELVLSNVKQIQTQLKAAKKP